MSRLGVRAGRTYSVCKLMNTSLEAVDHRSSFSIIQDDVSKMVLTVKVLVENNVPVEFRIESCAPGPAAFQDVQDFVASRIEAMSGDPLFFCAEQVSRAAALRIVVAELQEFGLAPKAKKALGEHFDACMGG